MQNKESEEAGFGRPSVTLIGFEGKLIPEWYHERTERIGPFEIKVYGSDLLSPSGPTNFGPVFDAKLGIEGGTLTANAKISLFKEGFEITVPFFDTRIGRVGIAGEISPGPGVGFTVGEKLGISLPLGDVGIVAKPNPDLFKNPNPDNPNLCFFR